MGILSDGGTFDPVCRSSMAHRKTQEGGASSNRQTSPAYKRPPSQSELLLTEMAVFYL